jgi:NADH-quinone oxidoreductase subunit C
MVTREKVSVDDALARVKDGLGSKLTKAEAVHGHLDLACDPANIVDVVTRLRDDIGLKFFTFLSAIDRTEYGDTPGPLEVFVHLYAPDHVLHATLHVEVDLENPVCPSITGVFLGALWHERETHEMFGIDFEGHPKLVGLYLPEDFEGHPLRRSFKLPSRTSVKDWPGAKDPEEAAAGGH